MHLAIRMSHIGCSSPGGEARAQRGCVNMKTSCLTSPKRSHCPADRVRDSSDQRHGFWWAIGKARLAAGEGDHFGESDAHTYEANQHGIENVRKRPGQRMQRTALIVQIKQAVMVIGIR